MPEGLVACVTLTFDGRVLANIAPARESDVDCEGLLIPGLVNGHTHLELSDMGLVPGGQGLVAWIRAQFAARPPAMDPATSVRAAETLHALGVAAVCDVAGGVDSSKAIANAGLSGLVQRELLGQDEARMSAGLRMAPSLHGTTVADDGHNRVMARPTAHAPYSTHPELARGVLGGRQDAPATIHLAEDPAERQFLGTGEGPFASLLNQMTVDWSVAGPYGGPLEWLDQVDGLGPHVVPVHGTDLSDGDLMRMASLGVGVIVCPRSNQHIGGRLPPAADMVARGLTFGLGTDGLVSCPDLDVVAEIEVLHKAFPRVPVGRWLQAATGDGAKLLGLGQFGALRVGTAPGLVQLDSDLPSLGMRPPSRRWLVESAWTTQEAMA